MIISGAEQIAKYRLCVLKQHLKLEKMGMKHSGGAIRPRIAAELGLKPLDSHDKFIAKIEELLNV
jgi:hypothetical protein